MRIFLTGGTAFIGQRLTKALVAKGWDVNPGNLEFEPANSFQL
jgi:uncharacterized protein YbjT (DUF2867 family)